jgi:hypothetical protein
VENHGIPFHSKNILEKPWDSIREKPQTVPQSIYDIKTCPRANCMKGTQIWGKNGHVKNIIFAMENS